MSQIGPSSFSSVGSTASLTPDQAYKNIEPHLGNAETSWGQVKQVLRDNYTKLSFGARCSAWAKELTTSRADRSWSDWGKLLIGKISWLQAGEGSTRQSSVSSRDSNALFGDMTERPSEASVNGGLSDAESAVSMSSNQSDDAVVANDSQVILHPKHASPESRDDSTVAGVGDSKRGMIAELKFSAELSTYLQGLAPEKAKQLKSFMTEYALINEKQKSASNEEFKLKRSLGKELGTEGISYNIETGMFQKTTEGLDSTVKSAAQAINEGVMTTPGGQNELQKAALKRGESFVEPQSKHQTSASQLPGGVAHHGAKL